MLSLIRLQSRYSHQQFFKRLFWSSKNTNFAQNDSSSHSDESKFGQQDQVVVDPSKPQPSVVIVGAGIAGLSAAQRLAQCGIKSLTILEAKSRPGGRIHSCCLGDSVVELGASCIEGACVTNPVFSLAVQEGLLPGPLCRQDPLRRLFCTSDGRAIDFPVSIMAYHAFRQIEQQASSLLNLNCPRTHGSLLNFMGQRMQQELSKFPESQRHDAARVMYGLMQMVRCRCGDDLSLVSAEQFGNYIQIPGGSVRIPLGFVGVLAPLLRDLQPSSVKYCKPVSNIRWRDVNVEKKIPVVVQSCDGEEFPADYVIVTVSLGVLKYQHEKLFSPDLPTDKVTAINQLGYGQVNKIFLEYKRPFWAWQNGGIHLAWSDHELAERADWKKGIVHAEEVPGSQRVLCIWICGPEAKQMEESSDEEVVEVITQVLRRFTNDPTLPYPTNLLRSKWCMDQHFIGAYSYMAMNSSVGHQCELSKPLLGPENSPVIFFAGEATMPGHYSTVHGARSSGIREAERIIQLIKNDSNELK